MAIILPTQFNPYELPSYRISMAVFFVERQVYTGFDLSRIAAHRYWLDPRLHLGLECIPTNQVAKKK